MFAYLEIREMLEQKAMDLAKHLLDPEELDFLLQANTPRKSGEVRLDNRLHAYWIDLSGNRYIRDFFELHSGYYETLFNCASLAESSLAANAEQHCEILRHLIKRNWSRAQRSLQNHIRRQQPKVAKLIESFQKDFDPNDPFGRILGS